MIREKGRKIACAPSLNLLCYSVVADLFRRFSDMSRSRVQMPQCYEQFSETCPGPIYSQCLMWSVSNFVELGGGVDDALI